MPSKQINLLLFLLLPFMACTQEVKKEIEKPSVSSTVHDDDNLLDVDTLIGADVPLHYGLKKIDQSFVMAEMAGDSGTVLHVFPDVYLEVDFKGKKYQVTKDSLLAHINQEYLSEALIGNVKLEYFLAEQDRLLFTFEVKKPAENFSFPFTWTVSPDTYVIEPIDE